MNRESWPKIIRDVGFDFEWDNKKVWALDVPVTEMPIDKLSWHFDVPFLWENGVYNLTPREVLDNLEKHKKEYARTMAVDLSYPIDIMMNKGRWLILDGLHRLMKAKITGHRTVLVRKIPSRLTHKILKS
ncbi:MAG: hypothetical protein ABIA93_02265 [Candidatus Woesearchaeota archaeon]